MNLHGWVEQIGDDTGMEYQRESGCSSVDG
jgi:hypothetical protein